MADSFASATSWTDLVETAYDREVNWALRDEPLFRNVVDYKPKRQAMPGDTVVLTLHQDIATATTPLAETDSGFSQAVLAPIRVPVTIDEYGSHVKWTIKLAKLAFSQPEMEIVKLLGRSQADSMDLLLKTAIDLGTGYLRHGAAGVFSAVAARNTVASPMTAALVRLARTKLVAAKAMTHSGGSFMAYIHPDVSHDLRSEAGPNSWSEPHVYSEPANIWAGEIGKYEGIRFIETTRATRFAAAGAASADVFPTYVFGSQALAEVCVIEPHSVIGPVTDPLKRVFPIGWHAMCGWAVYRQACLLRLETTSSVAALA